LPKKTIKYKEGQKNTIVVKKKIIIHHSTLSKHKQRTRGGGRFRRQDVGPGQFRVGGLPFGAAGQMFVGRNHQQPQHKIDISKIPQFGVHLW
jgi:hypothetical protein